MATVSPSPTVIAYISAYLMYATRRQSFQYGLYCVMFCVGKESNMVGVGGLKMDALQVPDFLSKKLSTITNCTSTLEEVFWVVVC